jgi:hypothetical protein
MRRTRQRKRRTRCRPTRDGGNEDDSKYIICGIRSIRMGVWIPIEVQMDAPNMLGGSMHT